MRFSWCVVAIAMNLCVACGGSMKLVSRGTPRALPAGAPKNECETAGWREVASATFSGQINLSYDIPQGDTAITSVTEEHTRSETGLSVFLGKEHELEPTADILPRMNEPTLAALHADKLRSYYVKRTTGTILYTTGLVAVLAPLPIMAAAESNEALGAALIAAGVGLVLGIVGLVVAPEPQERMQASTREQTFIPHEDDLHAVFRGVNRLNMQRRGGCATGLER